MSDFIEIEFLSGCLGVMPTRAIRLSADINSGYYVYDADDKLYSDDQAFHERRAVSKQEYFRICAHLKCLTRKSFVKSRLAPDDLPCKVPRENLGMANIQLHNDVQRVIALTLGLHGAYSAMADMYGIGSNNLMSTLSWEEIEKIAHYHANNPNNEFVGKANGVQDE